MARVETYARGAEYVSIHADRGKQRLRYTLARKYRRVYIKKT
jgi:hypothetical protein